MVSEWQPLSLREAGIHLIDCDHRTPSSVETGYPYIAIPQIKDGRIELGKVRRISKDDYEDWTKKLKPREHDVIVVRRCSSGDSAVVPRGLECAIGQNLIVLRSDGTRVIPEFLRWIVRGDEWWEQVRKFMNVGAVFNSLKCRDIPNFEVIVPPLDAQREITHLLTGLDDKITLLRETNATLEAIAQALFKSWFVDFGPVRAKAEGRDPEGVPPELADLFPSEFEDSELGEIPKGWSVQRMQDLASPTIGGVWGSDTPETGGELETICLRGVDLEHLRATGWAENAPIRWIKSNALEKRRLSPDEILIAGSGAGPVGRTLWIGQDLEKLYGRPVVFSNFVKRLKCRDTKVACYLDRILSNMRESGEMLNFVNGTSVPNLNDKSMLETKKVVLPSEPVLAAFGDFISPLMKKLFSPEARTLASLRDTLLPRLMSGKLRVSQELP